MLNSLKIPDVLIISKPISPPFNDSGKNLVRDIVKWTDGVKFHIFTSKGGGIFRERVINEEIYPHSSSYRLSLEDRLRVFIRLLKGDNIPIYHFFFAPNLLTSRILSILMKLKKGKKTIQTIMSSPKNIERIKDLIFTDYVITMSDWFEKILTAAGIKNVQRIYPGVELLPLPSLEEKIKAKKDFKFGGDGIILYAGDYEFGEGCDFVLDIARRVVLNRDFKFVIACRAKTEKSSMIEERLKRKCFKQGIGEKVIFTGEISDMKKLFLACDLQIFPCKTLYAKMDIPLVLLEGLSMGLPVIISDIEPLNEIMKGDIGLKIKSFDCKEWGCKIMNLITNKEILLKLRENCHKIVTTYFACERLGKEYENFYRMVIGDKK